ncbi:molybdenum cofactor guanylyltransferase [Robiginitomaculum antarcticum]|uniref:molybdenum cofactor guanylyltransferase n=1 Tax=Robiginitomaculum antarcticum TaxID=437507 RepID=UPI0003662255|nr:molybdenum cofactor guanylyltransferase [Robiginitomaculum antarcticum]
MSKICTLIVAGGQGRRIGGHKADTELCGKRLIDHTIQRAENWDLPIYIGLRRHGQVLTPGYFQILDKADIEGPLSGIIAGLAFAKKEGFSYVLTVACDMPFLPSDLVDWLLPAAQKSHKIVAANSGGRLHPICAIWPVEALETLEHCAMAGELSLNRSSKTYGREELEWPDAPYDPFFNINTARELERANAIVVLRQSV